MYAAFVWTSTKTLRMNGMHIMQCDHARLDLLSLVIWSRVFWPPLTWNLIKAQRWSKSVLTFDRSRPHSVTFCFFQFTSFKWIKSIGFFFNIVYSVCTEFTFKSGSSHNSNTYKLYWLINRNEQYLKSIQLPKQLPIQLSLTGWRLKNDKRH